MPNRCKWCNPNNPKYIAYHDREWGVLRTDDAYLFEMLLLESFQAGLSWECILNKRENFRKAFDDFQAEKIVAYTAEKGRIFYETGKATSPLSDAISTDLQKRGMKFVGSTIIYAYLQAVGILYSHDAGCDLYRHS